MTTYLLLIWFRVGIDQPLSLETKSLAECEAAGKNALVEFKDMPEVHYSCDKE